MLTHGDMSSEYEWRYGCTSVHVCWCLPHWASHTCTRPVPRDGCTSGLWGRAPAASSRLLTKTSIILFNIIIILSILFIIIPSKNPFSILCATYCRLHNCNHNLLWNCVQSPSNVLQLDRSQLISPIIKEVELAIISPSHFFQRLHDLPAYMQTLHSLASIDFEFDKTIEWLTNQSMKFWNCLELSIFWLIDWSGTD